MTRFLTRKNAIALAVMAAICMLAIGAAPESEEGVQPLPWYSILPPLLAVTLAIVTGRILESLALAVLAGGLLSAVPQSPLSPLAWIHGLGNGLTFVWVSVSDSTNLQILAFVTLVLAMVAVVIVVFPLISQW
ncbi:MAG: hypothetical protein IID00_00635 [Chloroflexi bacterium]|nr:hypothetical protein [Chloroflexota bacterium]